MCINKIGQHFAGTFYTKHCVLAQRLCCTMFTFPMVPGQAKWSPYRLCSSSVSTKYWGPFQNKKPPSCWLSQRNSEVVVASRCFSISALVMTKVGKPLFQDNNIGNLRSATKQLTVLPWIFICNDSFSRYVLKTKVWLKFYLFINLNIFNLLVDKKIVIR